MKPESTKINASHVVILICGILFGAIPVAYTARNDAKFQRLRERMYKYHLLKLITEIEQLEDVNGTDLSNLKETAKVIRAKTVSDSNDVNEIQP